MQLQSLFSLWKRLSSSSIGKWLFSYSVHYFNPYTGLLGAKIEVLEKGHCEITLKDKKRNRNHLNSVHAIALTNLGEFCSGMAVLSSLDDDTRGIVKNISIEFIKKGRGTLRATSTCKVPSIMEDTEFIVFAEIKDDSDEIVSNVQVIWKLGKKSS